MSNTITKHESETVGRKYTVTRYGLHSRLVGGDGKWYGRSNYASVEECETLMNQLGKRYQMVGGLVIDFGKSGTDVYEYRIIKQVSECEVVKVETRKL